MINEIPTIQSGFEQILSKYNEARSHQTFGKNNDVWKIFEDLIQKFEKNDIIKKFPNLKISWSIGMGNWARIPWIAFLDQRETATTQKGVYCVYLFREDMSGLYLTFNQGVTEPRKVYGGKGGIEFLKKTAHEIRNQYRDLTDKGFSIDDNIDLLTKTGLGSDYEQSTIAYKFYEKDSVPLDSKIIEDLENVLSSYKHYVESKNIFTKNDKKIDGGEMQGFREYLSNKGFYYESDLIENFLLSLKVKPFVILTGNSGTGKTKIAQLFANYINNSPEYSNDKTIESLVSVGKSHLSGGWAFKRENFFETFPELRKLEGTYPININGIESTGRLVLTPRLFYDSKDVVIKKMLEEIAQNDKNKKIKLTIEAGNKKISRESGNAQIVPVGANWTENRHIVGFYNVITKQYETTESLNLLLKANSNVESPYFLILDEMNLSHVERYFSNFLSGIESNEPIPLHSQNNSNNLEIPSQIGIPQNLFIIGTVNVDETTYMFSPKVLDRANTIEFLTFPADQYMKNSNNQKVLTGDLDYLENPLVDIEIRNWSIKDLRNALKDVKIQNGMLLWDKLSDEINTFQSTLSKSGFDFGFRVVNEILRFMYVSWRYEKQQVPWINWERYFDAQIKQKILPKIHGSQRSLGGLLKELMSLCLLNENEKEPRNIQDIELLAKYRTSAKKLKEMDKTLHNQRYVSFTR